MPKRAGQGFLPSAETVLRRAGKPLNCREIVERATNSGLLQSRGRTPDKTLYALLIRSINAEGGDSRFREAAPGLFELRK